MPAGHRRRPLPEYTSLNPGANANPMSASTVDGGVSCFRRKLSKAWSGFGTLVTGTVKKLRKKSWNGIAPILIAEPLANVSQIAVSPSSRWKTNTPP
jgi:hypothetical protein